MEATVIQAQMQPTSLYIYRPSEDLVYVRGAELLLCLADEVQIVRRYVGNVPWSLVVVVNRKRELVEDSHLEEIYWSLVI
jgi:hypothetical protein